MGKQFIARRAEEQNMLVSETGYVVFQNVDGAGEKDNVSYGKEASKRHPAIH